MIRNRLPRRLGGALLASAATLAASAGAEEARGPLEPGARLCPLPIALPLSESEAEERRPSVERVLGEELRSAGFEVAEASAVEALTERVREEAGGFIDPATGMRDGERYRAYRARVGKALHEELGCDAQLLPAIVTLRASFISGVARWDGTSQQVSSTGRIVLNVLAGVNESGWVTAFSLWLRVLDLAGDDVAFRSAGVETPVQFAVVEDTDVLAEDQWLTDEGRLRGAMREALGGGGHALRSEGKP